jgi:hypothetical protein
MAGRMDALAELRAAQDRALAGGGDNAAFLREVGRPATEAMLAHAAGDYRQASALLRPVLGRAQHFGGSHAQRDLLDQTLIDAAERGGEAALARALRTERSELAAQRARAC